MNEKEDLYSADDLIAVAKYIKENEKAKPGCFSMVYITKVIYQDDTTVVFWSDGTKTVTKRKDCEIYNQEYALMMCILKKHYPHKRLDTLFRCWTNKNNERGTITLKDVRKREEE